MAEAMKAQLRILVLDDAVDVAQGIAEILDLFDYDVVLAHDGPTAIEVYNTRDIDIGLFDIRMPGMNGVEAFLEVRRQHADAKIIMMSGYADDDLITCALENGARGLLAKPFDPDAMLDIVNGIVSETSVAHQN
jgi:DNA-binding NtrC family response regulator